MIQILKIMYGVLNEFANYGIYLILDLILEQNTTKKHLEY